MLRTWGQSASSWEAAIRTNFTPSSLFEMEHARLATYNRKKKSALSYDKWTANIRFSIPQTNSFNLTHTCFSAVDLIIW